MTDWIILLVLIGEVIILTCLDKIIYGKWITPISLLAIPYTVVVLAAFLFAPTLGFINILMESVLIWLIGLLFFWIGGALFCLPLSKRIRVASMNDNPLLFENKSEKLALMLAWFTIFVMYYGLLVSLKSMGWQAIGTDEFSESYMRGFVGHCMVLSMVLTVFLIGAVRRDRIFVLSTIFILNIFYFIYGVKAWIIIPFLSGVFYRALLGRFKPTFSVIALILFIVYVIYNVVYLIGFGIINIESLYKLTVYESLFKHFCSYIFAGVLSFSELVRMGIGKFHGSPHVIFAPFLNLYELISSGSKVSSIFDHVSIISIDGNQKSNVNTLFGTLLLNLGYSGTFLYTPVLGIFAYMVFSIAMLTRNCWAMISWSILGVMLLLGWFDYYFGLLTTIELPVYCAILGILLWFLYPLRLKQRNNVTI